MNFKSIIGASCACFIITMSMPARTALVDHHSYTTDEDTDLDWLDMSFTDGLSYKNVASMTNVGSLNGWRFATSAEFDTLMFNAIGEPYIDYSSPLQYTQMVTLIDLFGSTYSGADFAYAVGYVDSNGLVKANARQFGYSNMNGYVQPDSDPWWDKPVDNAWHQQGSFLVRASVVPVPTAVYLFGSGLLGLIGVARRSVGVKC